MWHNSWVQIQAVLMPNITHNDFIKNMTKTSIASSETLIKHYNPFERPDRIPVRKSNSNDILNTDFKQVLCSQILIIISRWVMDSWHSDSVLWNIEQCSIRHIIVCRNYISLRKWDKSGFQYKCCYIINYKLRIRLRWKQGFHEKYILPDIKIQHSIIKSNIKKFVMRRSKH